MSFVQLKSILVSFFYLFEFYINFAALEALKVSLNFLI